LVEARPALWDKTLDIYKDKTSKESAWREINRKILYIFNL